MRKWLRRLLYAIIGLIAIVVAIPVVGLAYGFLTTNPLALDQVQQTGGNAAEISARLATEIPGYKRPEESTFLTYTEWAIVYAARDYAELVATDFPSAFPYWAAIGRFWQDYALMIRASNNYPFSFENHLMLMVIGVSHTVEHAVQWGYENTIGRLSEAAAGWKPTPEDNYQAAAAADYAAFLDQVPWYQFPYADKRAGLWALEPANGMATIRSGERRLGFGLAYSIKQGYAAIIKSGLDATSDAALLDISVWADGPVAAAIADEADTRIERDLGADGVVFVTKRYQVFTDMIPRLIAKNVRFVEIGGNRLIFLTMLTDSEINAPAGTQMIFDYALPTEPKTRRLGIVADVARLHETLPVLIKSGAQLEHVYDY